MRTCSNCGSGLGSSDVFCTNCGTGQDLANPEHGIPAAAVGGFGDPATTAVGTTLEVVTERGADMASVSQQPPPGQDSGGQQLNSAGTPSGVFAPAPRTATIRADETIEQKYMRQTRNATVFIAVIVGIV